MSFEFNMTLFPAEIYKIPNYQNNCCATLQLKLGFLLFRRTKSQKKRSVSSQALHAIVQGHVFFNQKIGQCNH